MKRELKHHQADSHGDKIWHCRAYPDEKGIETCECDPGPRQHILCIAEPIPMKRELKPRLDFSNGDTFRFIAEPIPMKRELKHSVPFHISIGIFSNCRAYPDEKGIETKHYDPIIGERQTDCRAWFTFSRLLSSCKTSAELGTIQHLDICMDSHMQCIC